MVDFLDLTEMFFLHVCVRAGVFIIITVFCVILVHKTLNRDFANFLCHLCKYVVVINSES